MTSSTTRPWVLRCSRCGRCRELSSVGGIRVGAWSTGNVTIGYCSGCRGLRWLNLQRAAEDEPCVGADPAEADADRTWTELLAYVSEGTVTAEAAEAIMKFEAPEHRKRAVAAQMAEGTLDLASAIKLLGSNIP